ncbi:MAG: radical SAM protein [Gemmataceae bacterium]
MNAPFANPAIPSERAHRVSLLNDLPADHLLIHEIYKSIQGESQYAGLPCVFVRTTVCDFRCSWCDTPHAFNQGERQSLRDVFDRVLSFNCPLVELTGGEPLLQAAAIPLMTRLCDAGKTVLLETSGGRDLTPVDRRVHVIMDLKCPDSGECDSNYWPNLDVLKSSDEVKFVISSRKDWDWTEATIRKHDLSRRFHVLVSGTYGSVASADLVDWVLASGLNVRFQLQLHKYVWDPKARGV